MLYIVPFVFDAASSPWMKFSAFSLVLIPLCFGYAIIRYRLMDVDIIFKRGLAYTAATAAVATIYFAFVALIAEIFHAQTNGPVGGMIAIVIAAFLVPAVPRMDSGASRPLLLPRPPRLPPHADRVRPHAHERSAASIPCSAR